MSLTQNKCGELFSKQNIDRVGIFFLLGGVVLMGVGYFSPYEPGLYVVFGSLAILHSMMYLLYYGLLAPPQRAFWNWVYMFFLFPKKILMEEPGDIIAYHFFNQTRFSFYEMFEVVAILAIILSLFRWRRLPGQKLCGDRMARAVWFSACVTASVGLLHYVMCLMEVGDEARNPLGMWRSLWPLMVGLIVWIAGGAFIRGLDDLHRIKKLAVVVACLLTIEFVIANYTNILPSVVQYYEFDTYLGQFRSAWQSTGLESGLLVGQFLIIGMPWFYPMLRHWSPVLRVATTLVLLFVLAHTYARGSVIAAVVGAFIYLWFAIRRFRAMWLMSALCVYFVIGVDWSGRYALVKMLGLESAKSIDDPSAIFNSANLSSRFGAQIRALEVFLDQPLLGCGPGSLWIFMAKARIHERLFGRAVTEDISAYDMYNLVSDAETRTNSHNLLVDMTAEYGVAGLVTDLLFLLALTTAGFGLERTTRCRSGPCDFPTQARVAAFAAATGLTVYFITQAVPLSFGVMSLMFRIVVWDPEQLQSRASLRPVAASSGSASNVMIRSI